MLQKQESGPPEQEAGFQEFRRFLFKNVFNNFNFL